jgi:hypothetical protein
MGTDVEEFVRRYLEDPGDGAWQPDRAVVEPSGLDAAGMLAALNHPALGRLGIPLMADLMAPEGSLYYDAIFGGFRGQASIRSWLLPAMAEIEFVEFVPTAAPVLFDDGEGGTSLDEWQMVANLDGTRIPLSLGVSVRRYRDGWITWACDVYDTGTMRQPPPPEAGVEAAPLPPWPRDVWPRHADPTAGPLSASASEWSSGLVHPAQSVHIDPLVGELHGPESIAAWLGELEAKRGDVVFAPLGPSLSDGTASVQEWVLHAVVPGDAPAPVLRGTTVRRYDEGRLVSSTDYFDTAPLADPDIQVALAAAGWTLTEADIARHRG